MKAFKSILPFIKKYWLQIGLGFLFMLVQNYGFTKVPHYMKLILTEVQGANRMSVMWEYIFWALGFTVLTGFSMFLMRQFIIGASRFIEYELRKVLFEKLTKLDFSFYQKNQTGDLISRSTNDLDSVRTLLGPGIMYIPNSLSRLAFFAPAMIALSPSLSLALFGLIVFLVSVIFFVLPKTRPFHQAVQEQVGAINNRAWQTITGIHTLKLYTREQNEAKRFQTLNEEYIRRSMKIALVQGLMWPFFISVFTLSELILLYLGGKAVIAGELSLGELLQWNVMVGVLTFPVLSLGWVMSMLQQGISAMVRINHILEAPLLAPTQESGGWKKLDPIFKKLEFKQLDFTYPNATRKALENIDFSLQAGETIGLTGGVGSGKSTLADLLTGILRPERGQFFVNGQDIFEVDPEALYELIAMVPQEPFLFSMSLKENISLGKTSSFELEKVRQAATLASLDRDIEGFQDKYDQLIGERGLTLSGGQKQRTAIARAFYKDSPILLFDDSLSSVDSKTEEQILESIRQVQKQSKKSLLLISHRISALKLADRIYVLDQGKVSERGTHVELMEANGSYAKLAAMQRMQEELKTLEVEK